MAITFGMTGSQFAVWRRFVGRIIVNVRYGMSAPKGKMVSWAGEMFRRSGRDETFRAKIRIISICGKLEDFSAGKVPGASKTFVAPAGRGTPKHRAM